MNNKWLKEYYASKDLFDRKEMLEKESKENHSEEIKKISEMFNKRFDFSNKNVIDNFVAAWMTMRMYANSSFFSANIKKAEEEITRESKRLCVLDNEIDEYLIKEWHNFASFYLHTCLNSRTYGARFLTYFRLKEDELALKIAEDIDYGTRAIPAIANLRDKYEKLREIMIEEYKKEIPDGEKHWKNYLATIEKEK